MFLNIQVHSSATPEEQKKFLRRSLETRIIHPRLHYETPEQAYKWIKIHRKYSPAAKSLDALEVYKNAGRALTQFRKHASFQVISLGCGTGAKDRLILEQLQNSAHSIHYFPCDISLSLVLEAQSKSSDLSHLMDCTPIVCDLKKTKDLADFLKPIRFPEVSRVFLFFGILPNMEPQEVLKCLQPILKPNDFLLLSANLAPHADYIQGIQSVLPQYDNPETRDWLLTFIENLGVSPESGNLRFEIRGSPTQKDLKRIEAIYEFKTRVEIKVDDLVFKFSPGDSICLFFSNRYTSDLLKKVLGPLHISKVRNWTNSSQDETVVLGQARLNS